MPFSLLSSKFLLDFLHCLQMAVDDTVVTQCLPDWSFADWTLRKPHCSLHKIIRHPLVQGLCMDQVGTVRQLDEPCPLLILRAKENQSDLFLVAGGTLARANFPTQPYAGVAAGQTGWAGLQAGLFSAGLAAEGCTGPMTAAPDAGLHAGVAGLPAPLGAPAVCTFRLAELPAEAGKAAGLLAGMTAHLQKTIRYNLFILLDYQWPAALLLVAGPVESVSLAVPAAARAGVAAVQRLGADLGALGHGVGGIAGNPGAVSTCQGYVDT